jgi:hypothetical protein
MFRVAGAALLVCLIASTPAFAQSKDDPSLGTWELNAAQSKYTGMAPNRSDTRSYEFVDGWLLVTTETVNGAGNRSGVRFVAKFDGKEYQQVGRFAPTIALITYKPVNKSTLQYTVRTTAGKLDSTSTRTISADGKTMTIEQKSTDAKGNPVSYVQVWDRQP